MLYHIATLLLTALGGVRGFTPLCLDSPPILLVAGKSPLGITVDTPADGRCEATVQFEDTVFLPMRYSFETMACDGRQVNSFTIPIGVPNGEAHVLWQCTGSGPTCVRAIISGGLADSDLPSENRGVVGCVSEVLHTRTTLTTITRLSSTVTSTLPTVFKTKETSLYTPSSEVISTTPSITPTATRTSTRTVVLVGTSTPTTPSTVTSPTPTFTPSITIEGDKSTKEEVNAVKSSSGDEKNTRDQLVPATKPEPIATDDAVFQSDASRTTMLPFVSFITTTILLTTTLTAVCGSE